MHCTRKIGKQAAVRFTTMMEQRDDRITDLEAALAFAKGEIKRVAKTFNFSTLSGEGRSVFFYVHRLYPLHLPLFLIDCFCRMLEFLLICSHGLRCLLNHY